MTALAKHKMTVDEFLAWAETQPGRWELYDDRLVIHHARGSEAIATRIVRDGSMLKLDPPGLDMAVAEFFPLADGQGQTPLGDAAN